MPQPARAQPLPAERRARDLSNAYRDAQRIIVAEIRTAVEAGDTAGAERRRQQLTSVLRTLDQLGRRTSPEAREIVQQAFEQSVARTGREIAQIGVSNTVPASFAGVSADAVQALQDSIVDRLDNARRTVGRQVGDVFARQQRRAAMLSLLGAHGSPDTAAAGLRQALERRGQTAFVDIAGRRWALADYADMAVRTVTREAVVEGSIARMTANGVNLARVSAHASSCEICKPWEGRLVSLDGSSTDYEGEAVTDLSSMPNSGPPFHPRCGHSLHPVAVRIEAIRRQLQEKT